MSQPYGQDPHGYQPPQYPPQHGYPTQQTYGPPPRRKKSSAPLVLVVIGVVMLVMFGGCAVLIAALGNGGNEPTTSAVAGPADDAEAGTGDSAKKTTKEQVVKTAGIGDTVRDGKFAFTVTKLEKRTSIGTDFLGTEAQGVFLLVHVTVENIGDEGQSFFGSVQKLHADGKEFDVDTGAAIYLEDSKSLYEKINPGNKVRGIVVFDVPKSVKPDSIELHDSMFSGGVRVDLR
ncbi:DUF4352 domain-containing protein [Nonomuraea glycinis]|uniref:DUF4352 domain-containing protein n=1 Tax=Nonomuraea glycinis TaxID=2047744 RepID=UPI0033A86DD4